MVATYGSHFQDSQKVQRPKITPETTVSLSSVRSKAVPPDSLILYIGHAQHDAGNIVYSDAVARLVAEASAVPVYGTSDLYIGSGVVGGVMRRTSETGARVDACTAQTWPSVSPQDATAAPDAATVRRR